MHGIPDSEVDWERKPSGWERRNASYWSSRCVTVCYKRATPECDAGECLFFETGLTQKERADLLTVIEYRELINMTRRTGMTSPMPDYLIERLSWNEEIP